MPDFTGPVRGRFITFEGIDGSGKSTQIPLLADFLRSRGIEVVLTREPGGTPLAEKIRTMILADEMTLTTETLLFFAARAEHVAKVIRPALERGAWVLSDRFTDATYAYQVGAKGMAPSRVAAIEAWTLDDFAPDATLLFDLDPAEAARRRGVRGEAADRFEKEAVSFFTRVRNAYLERARANPRIIRLDATRSPGELATEIQGVFQKWL